MLPQIHLNAKYHKVSFARYNRFSRKILPKYFTEHDSLAAAPHTKAEKDAFPKKDGRKIVLSRQWDYTVKASSL